MPPYGGEVGRGRDPDDVERLVAPDQDETAEQGWRYVVGVGGAAGDPLGLHAERQERRAIERPPQQLIDGKHGRARACGG